VLALCETFHCLPSQLLAEDASVLRLLHIRDLGARPEEVTGPYGE